MNEERLAQPRERAAPPRRQDDAAVTLPPHSQEAEEAALGSLLMNPAALIEVQSFLAGDDFFILRHGWIYDALLRISGRGDAIDTRTLAEELKARGQLDDIGGEAYLRYLPTTVPTPLHAEVYGRIVERAAVRRRLLGAAGQIAQLASDQERDIEQVIDGAESALFAITEKQAGRNLTPIHVAISDYFDRVEAMRSNTDETKTVGVPTGFTDVDGLLGGLQKSDLVFVAGRPGMGKSSWLLTVALNAARAGAKVAVFSMEMSNEQLVQRMVSMETGLNVQDLRLGKVNDAEWSRFVAAAGNLSQLGIYLDDSPALAPMQLRARCRRLYREGGLDLGIVDYAQLMNAGSSARRDGNRVQELSYITRSLKELARELNAPLLVAAQLNRDLEKRKDKRPQLSDLKDSGSLEQDADVVLFLYRDEVYNEATEHPGEAEVIIAKHRNGPTGVATLLFRKEQTKFVNMRKQRVNLNDLGSGTQYNDLGEAAK